MPAGVLLDVEAVQHALNLRKTAENPYASSRKEPDSIEWLSGLEPAETSQMRRSLGTPIAFLVRNQNARSEDYEPLQNVYRPSHADYTWEAKFGLRDARGGGRSSARETVARVVAGDLARQILPSSVVATAFVSRLAGIASDPALLDNQDASTLKSLRDSHFLRCPDAQAANAMEAKLRQLKEQGDTAGGVIAGRIDGVPAGWGEPVFDKLHAVLGHALLSINAVKGVAFGDGFAGADLRGSQHNDAPDLDGVVRQNREGGITGGISNGRLITVRIAFKPVSSIALGQNALNAEGEVQKLSILGRHDALVVPRALPIVESMAALTLADAMLSQRIQSHQL
jgi:chorismate synthase